LITLFDFSDQGVSDYHFLQTVNIAWWCVDEVADPAQGCHCIAAHKIPACFLVVVESQLRDKTINTVQRSSDAKCIAHGKTLLMAQTGRTIVSAHLCECSRTQVMPPLS
jgi:hypothetical protein